MVECNLCHIAESETELFFVGRDIDGNDLWACLGCMDETKQYCDDLEKEKGGGHGNV